MGEWRVSKNFERGVDRFGIPERNLSWDEVGKLNPVG